VGRQPFGPPPARAHRLDFERVVSIIRATTRHKAAHQGADNHARPPLPSMLIAMALSRSRPMNAALVNWLP